MLHLFVAFVCAQHADRLDILTMDLVSVGGIGFDSPLALSSSHACSLVWCHLRPSGVMPRYLGVSIPCRINAPVPHQSFSLSSPVVSVIDMFLSRSVPSHSLLWATLTDLSYQNRAMPASLLFRHPLLLSILWTSTVFPRTLDDDVVVTLVFRPTITKFVLATMSVQTEPV